MIPILYDKSETAFDSNGLGRLADCISCTVTEERNGIYECQFTYPITGDMYSEIQEGRIIGVIHDDVHDIQPFDIYSRSAPLNGVVTFYAHHISYRLGSIVLKPMTALSCAGALAAIPDKTYTDCPFTFWTDKTTTGNWKNEVPNAVRAILGGQKGSILDVFGTGEYEWDKWTVKLYASRGVDQGVSIRYGVNLTDLKHDIDISGAYSAAVPYWKSTEDDTIVTLDSGYVKVALPQLVPWTDHNGNEITDNNGNVIYFNAEASAAMLRMTVMDLSEAFEEQPTQEQLRAEALRRLTNSEAWLPSENITVKFVDLSHTEEYKDIAALQRVRLCDRVSVYCGPMGVSAVSMQVIKVKFNVLTERYDEIELGKAKVSFAQAVTAQVEEITKDMPTKSMMQEAINNATNHITGANGGHVRFIYDANGEMQEILIMDTDDINTAVKVWRWNSGGFGFSSNGYAGPYNLAMTMDGAIVADMITAGHALFNILQGGVLTLGGINNTSGAMVVKDANGNTIGTWNNGGMGVSGNFSLSGGDNSLFEMSAGSSSYFKNTYESIEMKVATDDDNTTYVGMGRLMVMSGIPGQTPPTYNTYGLYISSVEPRFANYAYTNIGKGRIFCRDSTHTLKFSVDEVSLDYYGKYMRLHNCDLSVDGTKSRSVTTDQYSDRLLYCYETPTPMFGDIGEGVISDDGLCYVWLDAVFAQTITTDQYQVFLQRYGEGECYVKERRGGCFIVAGTPGLSFGWEVKAKQRDYDQLRLEKNEDKFTVPVPTYGEDAAQHIDEIRKEREAA